jgi:hypothetical protein
MTTSAFSLALAWAMAYCSLVADVEIDLVDIGIEFSEFLKESQRFIKLAFAEELVALFQLQHGSLVLDPGFLFLVFAQDQFDGRIFFQLLHICLAVAVKVPFCRSGQHDIARAQADEAPLALGVGEGLVLQSPFFEFQLDCGIGDRIAFLVDHGARQPSLAAAGLGKSHRRQDEDASQDAPDFFVNFIHRAYLHVRSPIFG